MKDEIIKAIKEGTFYEWTANNFYKLSNEQLSTILLEYIYAVDSYKQSGELDMKELIENINEYLSS